MVEVDDEHVETDDTLCDALETEFSVSDPMPEEVRAEVKRQIGATEEAVRLHQPEGDGCSCGFAFEGTYVRHLARHMTYGAYLLAAIHSKGAVQGYESALLKAFEEAITKKGIDAAVKHLRDVLREETGPKKPLVN